MLNSKNKKDLNKKQLRRSVKLKRRNFVKKKRILLTNKLKY